jgi:hypothetical protein
MAFFGKTEIFMVNNFGLPFDSGTIFVFCFCRFLLFWIAKYTKQKGLVFYNTVIFCILIYFNWIFNLDDVADSRQCQYRINENKPSDAAEVLAYYNREQYGINPLFYGPQYTDSFCRT